MTTSLDTSILRLHVTMAEPDAPETLLAVSEKFRNLDALLLVCSLAHQSETAEQPIIDEKSLEFTKVSLFAAHQDAASFVVARVRYESPWRLVLDYGHLLVGGGGLAALYAIARKAMTLVDRANETRERYWQANAKIARAELADDPQHLAHPGDSFGRRFVYPCRPPRVEANRVGRLQAIGRDVHQAADPLRSQQPRAEHLL